MTVADPPCPFFLFCVFVVIRAREKHGVLAITAGKGDIIRLVPPLVLSDEDIAWAADGINKAIVEVLGA